MGKQSRVLRCYHCGAILQCENEDEKGYIIPESLHRATPIQIIYCDRCFETMKAFNNSELEQKVDQEVLKILDDAFATDAMIIWVVDLFSFNGTLNSAHRHCGLSQSGPSRCHGQGRTAFSLVSAPIGGRLPGLRTLLFP